MCVLMCVCGIHLCSDTQSSCIFTFLSLELSKLLCLPLHPAPVIAASLYLFLTLSRAHTHTHTIKHMHTNTFYQSRLSIAACSGEGGGTLIDRRGVSEWKAENYIFYSSLKGQTHIAVIGIFTRQPPRCIAGWREERERGGAEGKVRYKSKEEESGCDPWPFHRQIHWRRAN